MYIFLSLLATATTVLMFMRMHHVHGSDTLTERMIITVGCILFLIQAGLAYHTSQTDRTSHKRIMTASNIFFTLIYSALFFWFVDFNRDSIFSTFFN